MRIRGLSAIIFAAVVGLGACGARRTAGVCAKACTVAADCCPPATAGCPGAYPFNYECTPEGLCKAPHCVTSADCASLIPILDGPVVCISSRGLSGCTKICAVDADCMLGGLGGAACNSKSDDGQRICGAIDCRTPGAQCLGALRCMADGRCGCTQDSDCGSGKVRCVGGTCGCADSSDCQPKLDVCSDDPAYRYPPQGTARPAG